MKLTAAQRRLLDRGQKMEHMGGFYAADRREWRNCEALRAGRLLKFWNGRKSSFWSTQFYTVTDAGRKVLET